MPKHASKTELRRELHALRDAIENKTGLELALTRRAAEWLSLRNFSSVFSYLSTEKEASTFSLLKHLLQDGEYKLCCPKIIDQTTMIAVEFSSLEELDIGTHGILTAPASTPAPFPIDLALVPGLGFTEKGARLGYGAGYYDRWFSFHPNAVKVAFCFECQVLPFVPTEAHDVTMDFIITEQFVRDCKLLR